MKTDHNRPLKVFRAYAEEWRGRRYYYVQVRVAPTRKAMHRDMRSMCHKPTADTEGQCSGISHYGRNGRLTGRFALMWLNSEDVRRRPAEIVSHECVHAAMRLIINKRVDLSQMAGEEALCYVAGSLTQQISDKLHKLGVFT